MSNAQPFDPARERYVSLATYRRSGAEVATPVWMAPAQGRHYVFSAGDAGKVKRIRHTSRVRLAACDARGKIKSDWIEGAARIVTDPATMAVALGALRAKYGIQMRIADLFSKLFGRFDKRAYLEISLN